MLLPPDAMEQSLLIDEDADFGGRALLWSRLPPVTGLLPPGHQQAAPLCQPLYWARTLDPQTGERRSDWNAAQIR